MAWRWVRTVVLALALVLQAGQSGTALAGANAAYAELAAHCAQRAAEREQPGPRSGGSHRHDCASCSLCAEGAFGAALAGAWISGVVMRFGFPFEPESGAISPPSVARERAHPPRAPPVIS